MPDPYASIAQTDTALQARLARVLELRAADPQQQVILNEYLSAIPSVREQDERSRSPDRRGLAPST